jgi:FtsP/CotA-like multicopper oxidase with cupredoxin domain
MAEKTAFDLTDRTNPGTWALHCRILPHAESDGMFGMVTAWVIQA